MLPPIIAVDPDGTAGREQEASHQHLRQKPGTPGNSGAEPSRNRRPPVPRTAPGSVRNVRPCRTEAPWNAIAIPRPATVPAHCSARPEQPVVAHRMGYTTRSDLGAGRFGPYGIVPAA